MDLRQARVFLAVCDQQNFKRASEQLFVSSTSVSETIALLERQLGTQLFTRTTRSVELTGAAHELIPHVQRLLESAAALDHASNNIIDSDVIRVGTFYGHGSAQLRTAADAIGLNVELAVFEWGDPSCGLATDASIDAAIITGPTLADAMLDRDTLWTEPRVAALPPGHALAQRRSITLDEVDQLHWVNPVDNDPVWKRFWRLDTERGGPPKEAAPPLHSGGSVAEAASQGNGVLVSIKSYGSLFPWADFAFVPVDNVPPAQIDLAYRKHRNAKPDQPKLDALSAALRQLPAPV